MTPAFLPVWILIAPLALVVADWLFAPKTTSLGDRYPATTYAQSPSVVAR